MTHEAEPRVSVVARRKKKGDDPAANARPVEVEFRRAMRSALLPGRPAAVAGARAAPTRREAPLTPPRRSFGSAPRQEPARPLQRWKS